MDLFLEVLEHFIGDDTDPIDLLPLVVLGFLVVAVKYLRSLVLKVLIEIGALRAELNLLDKIRELSGKD